MGKINMQDESPSAGEVFDTMRHLVKLLRQFRLAHNETARNTFLELARTALARQQDRVARLVLSAAVRTLLPPKTVKRAKKAVDDSVIL